MRVAIIGGGVSGLAAALHLAQDSSNEFTLYEAGDRLGGVLETIYDGPYLIERSADNLATLLPDAWQLCCEQGLQEELIPPVKDNRRAFVLNRGRILPIPAGFSLMQPTRIGSILTTRTLSWRAKLRLLGEFWVPSRDSQEDESLESFSVRRLGRETYANLVEPIVSGIFTADPSTLSMRATMPQFVEMERTAGGLIRGHLRARRQDAAAAARKASGARYDQFVAPRKGMSHLISELSQRLPAAALRLNTPVQRLQYAPSVDPHDRLDRSGARTSGRWTVDSHLGRQTYDAVICATPVAVTAKLLSSVVPSALPWLNSVPYASSAVVAMVVSRADLHGRTDGFGLIVPRNAGRPTLAISYTSNKYPGRVPDDQILLRIFLGGALQPHTLDLSDEQLIELATTELRDILGWQGRVAKWQGVIRWRESMPQYLVGHVERMQQLEQALCDFPSLKLCGAGYSGVGIPQCVRSGRSAARQLLLWRSAAPASAGSGAPA